VTFAEVMWRYLLANLAVNGIVAVVSGGVAALLVYLIMRDGQRAESVIGSDGDESTVPLPESDEQLLSVSYAAGVVKAGGDW
jgi:hypothetical protein